MVRPGDQLLQLAFCLRVLMHTIQMQGWLRV